MVPKRKQVSRGGKWKMLKEGYDDFGGEKDTSSAKNFFGEDDVDAVIGCSIGFDSEEEHEQKGDLVEKLFDELANDNDLENNDRSMEE